MHRLRALLRSLVIPVVLYCVSGTLAFYFVWHGVNGQRGLKTGEEYEVKLAELRRERDLLKYQRMRWEARIALIKGEKIDADVLEEETRKRLGRVHKNDVVVLLPEEGKR
jgi:cell division protein FtsB